MVKPFPVGELDASALDDVLAQRARIYTDGSSVSVRLDRRYCDAILEFETSYFEFHLANANGSMTQVARTTLLERTHLYRRIRYLELASGLKLLHSGRVIDRQKHHPKRR